MQYRIKNWTKFQHFKNRRPPWIKLYRDLLDDPKWFNLPPESSKFLTALWLLASEDNQCKGYLPDISVISFRYRLDINMISKLLSTLTEWVVCDDINMISKRYQDDTPETEGEREIEKETKGEAEEIAPPPRNQLISHLQSLKPEFKRIADHLWQAAMKQEGATDEVIAQAVIEFEQYIANTLETPKTPAILFKGFIRKLVSDGVKPVQSQLKQVKSEVHTAGQKRWHLESTLKALADQRETMPYQASPERSAITKRMREIREELANLITGK